MSHKSREVAVYLTISLTPVASNSGGSWALGRLYHTPPECSTDGSTSYRKYILPFCLAVGETVILLHPPLPLVGVSMGIKQRVLEK